MGYLTETDRLAEEVHTLTSRSCNLEESRSQLGDLLRKCPRESRRLIWDQLEYLAGVTSRRVPQLLEMQHVVKLIPGSNAVLCHTHQDAFRAVARGLAPRVNAHLLAMSAIVQARDDHVSIPEGTFLARTAQSLAEAGLLPLVPPRWPFAEVCE